MYRESHINTGEASLWSEIIFPYQLKLSVYKENWKMLCPLICPRVCWERDSRLFCQRLAVLAFLWVWCLLVVSHHIKSLICSQKGCLVNVLLALMFQTLLQHISAVNLAFHKCLLLCLSWAFQSLVDMQCFQKTYINIYTFIDYSESIFNSIRVFFCSLMSLWDHWGHNLYFSLCVYEWDAVVCHIELFCQWRRRQDSEWSSTGRR